MNEITVKDATPSNNTDTPVNRIASGYVHPLMLDV
jgi:hypothetical protein